MGSIKFIKKWVSMKPAPLQEGEACIVCGKNIPDYVPEYCCSAIECGVVVCNCRGQPIDPPICSDECWDKYLDYEPSHE